ncbi:hypothetical protein AB4Y45_27855 [Paraburkholderia sp. EG287A]|uniref:hypothetical protein n=1 Tax=Paraburkholderia sp. EG287A TaxID=3237012 RepID=UPI0034D35DCD
MVAKITDEQWAAARERYETEEKTGYGTLAQALDCSRNLVVRRAQKESWQKRLAVVRAPKRDSLESESKVTESAVQSEARTPTVYMTADTNRTEAATLPSPTTHAPDRPAFANHADEIAWTERVVAERQKETMKRHGLELAALRKAIYDALKKVNQKGMAEASRAAETMARALQRAHAMELEHEAHRTRIELGALYGAPGPRPCIIVVHQREGVQIGAMNDPASVDARVRAERLSEARRIIAEAEAAGE